MVLVRDCRRKPGYSGGVWRQSVRTKILAVAALKRGSADAADRRHAASAEVEAWRVTLDLAQAAGDAGPPIAAQGLIAV